MNRIASLVAVAAACLIAACSSSTTVTGYEISAPASAVAGDAVALSVVAKLSDGTTEPAGSDVTVKWTTPATAVAVDPTATNPSDPLPTFGATPTAVFLSNPVRTDDSYPDVLFVLDAGTSGGAVDIAATVSALPNAPVTASITVAAAPTGDATRGQATYSANCSACHGTTADGTAANSDGSFTIDGAKYNFPAPGLNNAPGSGNLGNDPTWNAALLAFGARADVDNEGVGLRDPMPEWLVDPSESSGKLLTTQDFADVYAWLLTQTD